MIKIHSIFDSINGEVNRWGHCAARFIRFSGCNLRCPYCDVEDVNTGKNTNIRSLYEYVRQYPGTTITLTGGEPLLWRNEVDSLIKNFGDRRFVVETNGSIVLTGMRNGPGGKRQLQGKNVSWVVDFKMWETAAHQNMRSYEEYMGVFQLNLKVLRETDFVKILVQDENQLLKALGWIKEFHHRNPRPVFAISPSYDMEDQLTDTYIDGEIVEPIKFRLDKDLRRPVVWNTQIHKHLGIA